MEGLENILKAGQKDFLDVNGDNIFALAQVKNIYVNHQWKGELYRSGSLLWTNTSSWLDVGSGWTFGNYYPYYNNAQPGNYEFKISWLSIIIVWIIIL